MIGNEEDIVNVKFLKLKEEFKNIMPDDTDFVFEIFFKEAFELAQKHPRVNEPPLTRCPDRDENDTSEKIWNDFWRGVLRSADDPLEQIKKELIDLYIFGGHISSVYDAVTGGAITKPNTCPHEVIRIFEEHYESKDVTRDDVEEILNDGLSAEEQIKEIKAYFEIE